MDNLNFYFANFGIPIIAVGLFIAGEIALGFVVIAIQLNFLYNLTR